MMKLSAETYPDTTGMAALGEGDADGEGDAEALIEAEADGEGLGAGEPETDAEGEGSSGAGVESRDGPGSVGAGLLVSRAEGTGSGSAWSAAERVDMVACTVVMGAGVSEVDALSVTRGVGEGSGLDDALTSALASVDAPPPRTPSCHVSATVFIPAVADRPTGVAGQPIISTDGGIPAGVDDTGVIATDGAGDSDGGGSGSGDSSGNASGLDAEDSSGSALSTAVGDSASVLRNRRPRRTDGAALLLGESAADGDADGLDDAGELTDRPGERLTSGLGEELTDALGEGDGVGDADALALGDEDGLADGLGEIDGEAEADGLGVDDLLGDGVAVDETLRDPRTAVTSHSGGKSPTVGFVSGSPSVLEGTGNSAACAAGRVMADSVRPSPVTATTTVRMPCLP